MALYFVDNSCLLALNSGIRYWEWGGNEVSCQNGPGQGWAGIKLTFCQILHNDSHPSAHLVNVEVKY